MKLKITYLAALAVLLAACVKQPIETPATGAAGQPVQLVASIEQPVQTLVAASGYATSFVNGDKIGLYAVGRKAGETKALAASGNYADNVAFTFDGTSWSGALRYPQGDSLLDIYAYYPYDVAVGNATAIAFSVPTDQSTAADYNAGALLWAKVPDVAAGDPAQLTFAHRTAMVELVITGSDLTLLAPPAAVSVKLQGASTNITLGLATGTPAASSPGSEIAMYKESSGFVFRALVPAVTIPASFDLFKVAVTGLPDARPDKTYTCSIPAQKPLAAGSVAKFELDFVAPAIPPTPVVLSFTGPTFSTNDDVGIWVKETGAAPGTYLAQNLKVSTTDGGATWSYSGELNYPATGTIEVYAYHPHRPTATIAAVPFAVAADQSSHNAATPAALYWKKSDPAAKSNSPVAITLGAIQLADITLELLFSDGATFNPGDLDQTGATIPTMQTNGTIDLTSGTITPTGATSNVTMAYSDNQNDGGGSYTVRLFARLPSGQSVPSGEGAFTIQGPYSTGAWGRTNGSAPILLIPGSNTFEYVLPPN